MTHIEPGRTAGTWTFYGHWEDDRIVVEYYVNGEVSDDRVDTGRWDEGLWAASGSGQTPEQAKAALLDEYESDLAARQPRSDNTPPPPTAATLSEGTWVYFDAEPTPGTRTRCYGVISGVDGAPGNAQRYLIDTLTFIGEHKTLDSGPRLIPHSHKIDVDKVTVTTSEAAHARFGM